MTATWLGKRCANRRPVFDRSSRRVCVEFVATRAGKRSDLVRLPRLEQRDGYLCFSSLVIRSQMPGLAAGLSSSVNPEARSLNVWPEG